MATIKYTKQQLADELAIDGKNTYGRLVTGPTMTLDEVADEIAHITGMQEMACANVLRALPSVIYHYVRGGLGVDLGFAKLKPTIHTAATTEDEAVVVKRRALTMRLSTEMKNLLEQIKVTVQSDGTVDDADDPAAGGTDPGSDDDPLQP